MDHEEPDIKPFEYGFPKLHLLVPDYQTNMDSATSDPGLPYLTPANPSLPYLTPAPSFSKMQMKEFLINKPTQTQRQLITPGIKRKHTGLPKELKLAISNVRSISYKHLLTQTPRKPRTTLTKETKDEIINFHKQHPLLRQVEIADIFGIDRTTVTKLLKKGRQDVTVKEEAESWRSVKSYQYELEDILYRWIMRSFDTIEDWPDTRLLQQAEELQMACDISSNKFKPTLKWLYEFKKKFRLRLFGNADTDDEMMSASEAVGTSNNEMTYTHPPPEQFEPLDLQKNTKMKMVSSHKIPREKPKEPEVTEQVQQEPKPEPQQVSEPPEEQVQELSSEQVLNREMQSLEKFREQQKAIEEANKQKKALLAKTLTERKKRAHKEACKLEQIQKELSKLDSLLTADVQVIRGKIEEASREFLDAQKRFEKAEAEYVASKMDLHDKSEMKEQLTEHLYTIIHQNEVRKAKKLAELMKELEMEASEEEIQLPDLPPLTSFQQTILPLSPSGSKTVHSHAETSSASPSNQSDTSQSVGSSSTEQAVTVNELTSPCPVEKCDNINTSETVTVGDSQTCANIPETAIAAAVDKTPTSSSINTLDTHETLKCSTNVQETIETPAQKVEDSENIVEESPSSSSPQESSSILTNTAWDFDGSLK